MIKEFEAPTEKEAIELAVETLKIDSDNFDVEIIENQKKTLFKKGSVVIRVHYNEEETKDEEKVEEKTENEEKIIKFTEELLLKMGYQVKVSVTFRNNNKIGINIENSKNSSIIIGRKGKNLDAIQVIVNSFANNLDYTYKIVVDSENYRVRHEEIIVRNAFKIAEKVKKTGRSELLEEMNPFERRLIHTALTEIDGIQTISEGEGLLKQIRILTLN